MTTIAPTLDRSLRFPLKIVRPFGLAAIAAIILSTTAAGHHGWDWAEDEPTELTGIVRSVEISPPHPILQIEATDGTMWTVELGNPASTERSGFVEGTAEIGDQIIILGNRSSDPAEMRMKAVRVTIDDAVYDIYPERIPN